MLVVGLALFLAATNVVWILADRAPPDWDQADYLQLSLRLYRAVVAGRPLEWLSAFFHGLGGVKAPLVTVLPLPWYLLLGFSGDAAVLVNLTALVCFAFIFYALVLELGRSRLAALLAVAIVSTMPLVYGLSRQFYVEYLLMVWVTWWLYCLVKSDGLRSWRHIFWLGIIGGLGMLLKILFPVYVLLPAALLSWRRRADNPRQLGVAWATILALIFAVAGSWYLLNFKLAMGFAYAASFGPASLGYGMGKVWSPQTILAYWRMAANLAVSWWYAAALLLLSVGYGLRWVRTRGLRAGPKAAYGFLLGWLVLPAGLFTFGVNKDIRYLAPALPALAAVIALLVVDLAGRRRTPAAAGLMAFPLFAYLYTSFGIFPPGEIVLGQQTFAATSQLYAAYLYSGFQVFAPAERFTFGRYLILSKTLGYAHPPRPPWPTAEMVELLDRDFLQQPGREPSVFVVASIPPFNRENFNLQRSVLGSPLQISGTPFGDLSATRAAALAATYVVTKSGGDDGEAVLSKINASLKEELAGGRLPFEKIKEIPLPDGTAASVYRKIK